MQNVPDMLAAIYGQDALGGPDDPAPRHLVVHGGDPGAGLGWAEMLDRGRSVDNRAVEDLARRIAVRDTAMLIYTSVTTANPKGCLISHRVARPDWADPGTKDPQVPAT